MKREMAEHERHMLANKSHRNKESVNLLLNHFQKEFRESMDVDPNENIDMKLMQELDYSEVATIMLRMGFLQ